MSEIIEYQDAQPIAPTHKNSFESLLTEDIDAALELRLELIESEARSHRADAEAAKISLATLTTMGAVLSSSPLVAVIGGLGFMGYCWVVVRDFQKTKRFRPIPTVNKTLPELLDTVGLAAIRTAGAADHALSDTIAFVEPALGHEYRLLVEKGDQVYDFLSQFPAAKRLKAYRYVLRQTLVKRTLELPTLQASQQAVDAPENLGTNCSQKLPATEIQTPASEVPTVIQGEGAIEVPVTQIQNEQQAIASMPTLSDAILQAEPPSQPSPVAYLLGDRLRTALIVSVSGGGKDILLSNALRAFLLVYSGFQVVVMDCKDDPKEYGYYAGLPNVTVYRLNVAVSSDGEVVEWVDDCVEAFVRLPEKALLICNEGTLIRAKSKRYIQAVDGLVSSGDSRQKYCWEAGQSAHTDDLGINGAARSRFRMLIIGLKGEEMQIEAVLAAKFVADSARNMSDIKGQLARSPVQRAWCDGQRWFAMPVLQNYSGYDRDTRSMMPGFAAPTQQDTRAKLEGLYRVSGEMKGETGGEMISPQSETGETGKRDSETGETPYTASNPATQDDAVSRFISPGETGEIDPDRVRRVSEMKRSGLTQTQILLVEWGVKPGKSQAYLDAVEEYKALIDRLL